MERMTAADYNNDQRVEGNKEDRRPNLLLFGFMRRKRAELARVRAEQEKRA